MRVISNRRLVEFSRRHAGSTTVLRIWRKSLEAGIFGNFAELKRAFNTVDRVGDFYVFDVGGNKFRIVAAIHFNRQMVFIRHVFTHREYDSWRP